MVSTRRISLLALVVLVLTGCSGLSEAPTPLPTAVPPDDSPGSWSLAFQQEISLVDMGQGEHMYKFEINCPILVSGRYQDDWVPVVIDEDALVLATPVYLRLWGVSTGQLAPTGQFPVHPEQRLVAVVTFLGVQENHAQMAIDNCEILFHWDQEEPVTLDPGEPFQP